MKDICSCVGCYILRPSAFFIWERIQSFFDGEIKRLDVQNCQFPLFVTKECLETEQNHVEGFAAEVGFLEHICQKELSFSTKEMSDDLLRRLIDSIA